MGLFVYNFSKLFLVYYRDVSVILGQAKSERVHFESPYRHCLSWLRFIVVYFRHSKLRAVPKISSYIFHSTFFQIYNSPHNSQTNTNKVSGALFGLAVFISVWLQVFRKWTAWWCLRISAGLEILGLKVFWDVTPCSLVDGYQSFDVTNTEITPFTCLYKGTFNEGSVKRFTISVNNHYPSNCSYNVIWCPCEPA